MSIPRKDTDEIIASFWKDKVKACGTCRFYIEKANGMGQCIKNITESEMIDGNKPMSSRVISEHVCDNWEDATP